MDAKINDHEVKFNLSFRPASECYIKTHQVSGSPAISNASLYVDYIYLDTDERRQFAQVQHEYLVEQLQFTGAESFSNSSVKSKLALNHPCKELIWVIQRDDNVSSGANRWSDYTNSGTSGDDYAGGDTLVDAKLQLNGHDRFSTRKAGYFNLVQPYQHHTRIPAQGIYVYSFALNPEQHQPSGSVNMSRIDNATLLLNLATATAPVKLRTYAVNYNVLRIMAGIRYIHLCRTVICLLMVYKIARLSKENRLTSKSYRFATTSKCGKFLRAFATSLLV